MKDLKEYKKYYFLEKHLFEDVSKSFKNCGFLTPEEFFAIVIWKSPRSKKKVKDGIKNNGRTIKQITYELRSKEDKQKIRALTSIFGIGIPVASAILAVCYPDDFTVVDYRATTSLIKILRNKDFLNKEEIKAGIKEFFEANPSSSSKAYLKYCKICGEEKKKIGISLRDFDRILWAIDFYEGDGGLKDFVKGLN